MFVCPECGLSNSAAGYCPADGTQMRDRGDDALIGVEIGSYRVARLLGVGGMGRVYKAVHPTIGSRVAVKVLAIECAQNAELVERFMAEAKAANLIRHESIVNILDLSRLPDGRPYIIMEFLDGAPLAGIIEKQGPLPLGGLVRLTGEILSALGAAHQKGIVHRDLKPDNIFVSPQGRGKVLDFGIAKLMPELSGRAGPTRTGSLLGTPHYMAPEQAMAQHVDARTDVYAVGVILYEGATGQRPFQAASLFELLHKQVNESPVPPRRLRPDLPPELEAVILRAMAKNPAERFQTTDELWYALDQVGRVLPPAAWSPVAPGAAGAGARTPSMGDRAAPTPAPHPYAPTPTPHSYAPTPTPHSYAPTPGMHGAHPVSTNTPLSGQMQPHTAYPPPKKRTGLYAGIAALALVLGGAGALLATRDSGDSGKDPGQDPDKTATSGDGVSGDTGTADRTGTGLGDLAALQQGMGGIDLATLQDMDPEERIAAMQKLADAQLAMADQATRDAIERAQKQAMEAAANAQKQAMAALGMYQPEGFDPARFDITGFMAEAEAKARAVYDDAELERIDAQGVYPSGHADLTLADNYYVLYRYNSPSRAGRPKNIPVGAKYEPNCKFYVWVSTEGVRPYAVDGWECDEPRIDPVECSVREVWERAIKKGAPRDNAVADISLYTVSDKKRWSVTIGDVFSEYLDDTCK